LRGVIDLLAELPCRTQWAGHPLVHCAEPGPWPRLASKGDARGRGQAPAPRRLRPSLALRWPCAHGPGKPAPVRARPGIRAAVDQQQHRVLPGPPGPRPPSRPAAGASSESARPGAADCQEHSAGGGGAGRRPPAPSRKLGTPPRSTVAARARLTASKVATGRALSDDAADCGFAVPSRDRAISNQRNILAV
jgi:hypothetical protein